MDQVSLILWNLPLKHIKYVMLCYLPPSQGMFDAQVLKETYYIQWLCIFGVMGLDSCDDNKFIFWVSLYDACRHSHQTSYIKLKQRINSNCIVLNPGWIHKNLGKIMLQFCLGNLFTGILLHSHLKSGSKVCLRSCSPLCRRPALF